MKEMGSGFRIKVKTEILREKADTVSGLLEDLRGRSDEMYSRLQRTSSYWEGIGAQKRYAEYERKQKTIERMMRRLSEYPLDLLEMAGIYEDAEEKNREQMTPLASNVLI